jgi:hypothetical protein
VRKKKSCSWCIACDFPKNINFMALQRNDDECLCFPLGCYSEIIFFLKGSYTQIFGTVHRTNVE